MSELERIVKNMTRCRLKHILSDIRVTKGIVKMKWMIVPNGMQLELIIRCLSNSHLIQ